VTGGLVVVSGLPAAGKSTLSTRLGRDLPAVVVRRDHIRRQLLEAMQLAQDDPALPAGASAMTMHLVTAVLESGGTVVLDGNFNTERHMTPVRDLLRSRPVPAVEVCLWADADELRRRFIARADPPLTPQLEPYFEQVLHRCHEPVLDEQRHEVEHVDTTDPSAIDERYPTLLDRVRRAIT
jgi:predicted kinase